MKRSNGFRSSVEIPLVYTGELLEEEDKTKKSSNIEHKEHLTKEEQEAKEKRDRKIALNNLKKRTKYDPRKAILNEK